MDILILGGVLMKKIIRDFVLLFVLCFLYMTFSKTTNVSAVEGLIISLGSAAFLLCYVSMTVSFGETGLTFIKAIPFMIASLAPALVVCAISKELRMPSNRQEAKVELEELA